MPQWDEMFFEGQFVFLMRHFDFHIIFLTIWYLMKIRWPEIINFLSESTSTHCVCCSRHVVDYFYIFYMTEYTWLHMSNYGHTHGLRTPREEIAFTARPKIHSHSQMFRYSRSIFCLPHRPNFSDIFDLCLHWVSVVRGHIYCVLS